MLKFFLNVSQQEQHKRFLDRIVDPDDNWKFDARATRSASSGTAYMARLSGRAPRDRASHGRPGTAIPADSKTFMRRAVAEIVVDTLARLDLRWPVLSSEKHAEMMRLRAQVAED